MILLFTRLFCLMSETLSCPRCGNYSWIDTSGRFPVQRCVCGLLKYLELTNDGMVTTRVPYQSGKSGLPNTGTQLSKILGCLVALGELTSSEVAEKLNITNNLATTNLSVLRSRGLIKAVDYRRGFTGGSLWEVEDSVKKKFLGTK